MKGEKKAFLGAFIQLDLSDEVLPEEVQSTV